MTTGAPPAVISGWLALRAELDDQLCFIATPYARPDRPNEEIKTIETAISAAANSLKLHLAEAKWKLSKQQYMDRVHELIRNSRVVVAILPEPNMNVFFEIGCARALGKPVLILAREPLNDLAADIRPDAIRGYQDTLLNSPEGLQNTIQNDLQALLERSDSDHVERMSDTDYYLGHPNVRHDFRTIFGYARALSSRLVETRNNFLSRINELAKAIDDGSSGDPVRACGELKDQLWPYKETAYPRPIDANRLQEARTCLASLREIIACESWQTIENLLGDTDRLMNKYCRAFKDLVSAVEGLSEISTRGSAHQVSFTLDEVLQEVQKLEKAARKIEATLIEALNGIPREHAYAAAR